MVPPLAGFRLYAILGVFHHLLSVPSGCIILNCSLFLIFLSLLGPCFKLLQVQLCLRRNFFTSVLDSDSLNPDPGILWNPDPDPELDIELKCQKFQKSTKKL